MKSCAPRRVPAVLVLGTTSSVDIELWKTSIFHGFYHHVYPQCVLSCPSMKKPHEVACWFAAETFASEVACVTNLQEVFSRIGALDACV